MSSKHGLGNHEVEDGVAKELEALVVAPGRTAVRQRQLEQLRIIENIVQRIF